MLDIIIGGIASELLLIVAIAVVLLIIFKFGNIILGLIINSILGLIAIWLANSILSLGIIYNWIIIIAVAIFGLPAAAIIIILKILGISV
jgi:hypothetical protein